jgi:hypothetical protein
MFALFPLIGTFAAQNFQFAQRQKAVYPLDSVDKAKNLGGILKELKQSGGLLEMAGNGFGVHSIGGTQAAASDLASESTARQ